MFSNNQLILMSAQVLLMGFNISVLINIRSESKKATILVNELSDQCIMATAMMKHEKLEDIKKCVELFDSTGEDEYEKFIGMCDSYFRMKQGREDEEDN